MPHILMFFSALILAGVFSVPVEAAIESKSYDPGEIVILDESKATHFVESLDDLALIRKQMGDSGRKDPLRLRNHMLTEQNFAPYRTAIEKMQETSPDDYAAIEALAKKHEFASAEDWAETADGVMQAFFYIQQETEGNTIEGKMREQLTPEMMAKVPESHKYMIDNALKMAHKMSEVPEENERIVRGLMPQLQIAMNKNL